MDNLILFGRFLVRDGVVSEKDLLDAIKVQHEINYSFAAIALEEGFITLEDFKKALAFQRQKGIRFRDALLELKIADNAAVEKIDKALQEKTARLGELLVKRAIITEDALKKALEDFKEKGTVFAS